jgi:phosphohistidine phosphatase SixA
MKWFFRFLLLGLAALHASLGATELADALRSGNHVLLMRHALAPGVGDPAGYTLDRCDTQRNLDAQGKKQAARIGQWLRGQGVSTATVYSSPWCRCRETAEMLNMGPVQITPALASFFDEPQKAASVNQSLQAFIAKSLPAQNGRALILVTHHVNIREFMGKDIGSGDMVLAQVDAQGRMVQFKLIASP